MVVISNSLGSMHAWWHALQYGSDQHAEAKYFTEANCKRKRDYRGARLRKK
jgi:hypothetical protein